MKRRDVGRSDRTPAKHALMNRIYGREIGAVNSGDPMFSDIERLVWVDLTAGDGIPADGLEWKRNCSPGIAAFHATYPRNRKTIDITLYEDATATYGRLIDSLTEHLPLLDYRQTDLSTWEHGQRVTLRAVHGSGAEASVDHIFRDRVDAVLVSNDPNAITDWAMRPTFAQEIAERTGFFRSISTMGCNVGGLKRLELEDRAQWFELVKEQQAALPNHRDLLLAAIEGDASQWAYLLCEPVKWRDRAEGDVVAAFKQYGYEMDLAWYRSDPGHFEELKERLFLRPDERGA